MEIHNSLSSLLKQLNIMNRNSLEVFKKISDAITTNKETITMDVEDVETGFVTKVAIPSFGYLKREINRLDNNFKALSGINDTISNVKLKDGEYRKIVTSTLQKEADSLLAINAPESFNYKNNWFFENFLNPLLYINVDLTNKVNNDIKNILVRKYLLTLDSKEKIDHFNNNYNKRSDIEHDYFIADMADKKIDFYNDEEILSLPIKENIFYGNFNVLKIYTDEVNVIENGVTYKKFVQKYLLDKLTYSSKLSNLKETEQLKIGDSLIVNKNTKNTRFVISAIDTSINIITLDLIEGYDSINLGTEELTIYSQSNNVTQAEIPIAFNQSLVIFIKPISFNSNVPAIHWSPGISFYSNELKIKNNDGTFASLETFYKNEVVDFGLFMLGVAKEATPPAILGLKPDAPLLEAENFKVIEINQHLTKQQEQEELKKLQLEKNRLSGNLKERETTILEKRKTIGNKKYKTDSIEREADQNDLQKLEIEYERLTVQYNSLVEKINNLSKALTVNAQPKFRVRGFWAIPIAKVSTNTPPQEVVQFYCEYRYLNKSGSSNPVEVIKFKDNDGGSKSGSWSTWVPLYTLSRKKEYDLETDSFKWAVEDVTNAESININQIEIPITKGEKVELRIKALSEAGWPNNPVMSDYSNTVTVSFADDMSEEISSSDIQSQTEKELIKIEVLQELKTKGVDKHLSDSFTSNEKYYNHSALNIASGFLTAEQKPISMYDKILDIENRLVYLQDIINKAQGKIKIRLYDESGNVTEIFNGKNNKIFAGYYKDLVSNLSIKKGAIITKTYFLSIENDAASNLELLTLCPGNNKYYITDTASGLTNGSGDSIDYTGGQLKKYDLGAIINTDEQFKYGSLFSATAHETNYFTGGSGDLINGLFTSKQRRGQILYVRSIGLDGPNDILFKKENPVIYKAFDNILTTTSTGFVWNGTPNSTPTGSLDTIMTNENNGIWVHINHPLAKTVNGLANQYYFSNSSLATLTDTDANGKLQYASANELYAQPVKYSFKEDDQYLLGKGSCGSYLFTNINNSNGSYFVDGSASNSKKIIEFGADKSIKIPITFQFRMTDYFGDDNDGEGNIAGDISGTTLNLSYSKKLGFDLLTSQNEYISFDLEINAKYKSEGATLSNVPRII